ncbi:MAG: hypothetical protein U5K43_03330 [Halofilum sp. (in: g-proteobacteria)]|nr:hypothetical protein [Halofilum sp. (in: g-proteobacteria)]
MHADALRYRRLWLVIGYLLVAATAWGSLHPQPPAWAFSAGDKLLHAATYALLTFWFGQLYPGWRRQLGLAAAFTLLGVGLEVAQAYTSVYRHFDLADAGASGVGTVAAWALLRTRLGGALAALDARLDRRG